jgi:WD40 repeat protein
VEESERKLGPYTLVSKIGRGAFGVVWLAEKRSSIATTRFALKLPRDEDIDLEAFKQEASIWLQASGHPNVVPMIEADIYDDRIVIVSEYVNEGSLSNWLAQHGGRAPSVEAASEMIDGVLAGLSHLHARHIIHRDLKPDNILLQHETPRLADFGIARLLKSGSYSTNISGTLAYMAPEAFDGKRNEQTDVWSAGVIFYQLLAGRLPYDQTDTVSFVGAIMRHDPAPLPDTVPEVLRRIVMKALQREPANRYATAKEMRRDLREAEHELWQSERRDSETVQETEQIAAPPARIAQPTVESPPLAETQKLDPVTTAKAIEPAAQPLIRGKAKSRASLWLAGIAGALLLGILVSFGIYRLASTTVTVKNPQGPQGPQGPPGQQGQQRQQGPSALKQTLTGHSEIVRSVAFSPDGKTLASGSSDQTVKLWDVQTGALKRTLPANTPGNLVWSVAFSPDGKTLASANEDKQIRLWDAQTGALVRSYSGHSDAVESIAFSPDGKTLASGSSDRTVRLWDVQTAALKLTLTGHKSGSWSSGIWSVAFSPDGNMLASGSDDKTVKLWYVRTGELKQTLAGDDEVFSVAFSPDGKTLASGGYDAKVKLWDAQTGALKQSLTGHTHRIWSVAFSPDGKTLASGNQDETVKLWDAQTGALKQTLTGHSGWVCSVAFSPDGKTLASASADKTIKLWLVN